MTARKKEIKKKSKAGKRKKVRVKSFENLEVAHEFLSEAGNLPDSYGETMVVLLPIGPYLVHVYWEISVDELRKAKSAFINACRGLQPILRFYDVTNIIFDGTNALSYFDIDIELNAKNWYVHLWSPEKSYLAELGLKTKNGQFFPIARSNVAETPPAWPAPRDDERYMLVKEDHGLIKTHSMPIEKQPLQDLTTPLISQAEPDLLPIAQKEHHCEARPPLTAETLLRKPAELYKFQTGPQQPFKLQVQSTQDIITYYEKKSVDLTIMSEKRSTFGVSSVVLGEV